MVTYPQRSLRGDNLLAAIPLTGIELLEGLYSVSLDALNSYNTRGKAKLNRGMHSLHSEIISHTL